MSRSQPGGVSGQGAMPAEVPISLAMPRGRAARGGGFPRPGCGRARDKALVALVWSVLPCQSPGDIPSCPSNPLLMLASAARMRRPQGWLLGGCLRCLLCLLRAQQQGRKWAENCPDFFPFSGNIFF